MAHILIRIPVTNTCEVLIKIHSTFVNKVFKYNSENIIKIFFMKRFIFFKKVYF